MVHSQNFVATFGTVHLICNTDPTHCSCLVSSLRLNYFFGISCQRARLSYGKRGLLRLAATQIELLIVPAGATWVLG